MSLWISISEVLKLVDNLWQVFATLIKTSLVRFEIIYDYRESLSSAIIFFHFNTTDFVSAEFLPILWITFIYQFLLGFNSIFNGF